MKSISNIVTILEEEYKANISLDGDYLTIQIPYSKRAKCIFEKIVPPDKEIELKWCKECKCMEVVGKQKYCPKCAKKRQRTQQRKYKKNKTKL